MIGSVFGRLTVVAQAGRDKKRQILWVCVCACGAQKTLQGTRLRSGKLLSCGCLQREVTANRNRSHGLAGTRLYSIWSNMRARCENPQNAQYADYGGRGISICEEWQRFDVFAQWALQNGYDDHLSIDRIDNDAGYSAVNCRWSTAFEQSRNKRPRRDQKLTDAQVALIRGDHRPARIIARDFAINKNYVSRIKSGTRRTFNTERKGQDHA